MTAKRIRTWSSLTNPGLTLINNPSDSDVESHLKWMDGSAYASSSIVEFVDDMESFCHGLNAHQRNYKSLPCNETRYIICQYDCLNLNAGEVGSGSPAPDSCCDCGLPYPVDKDD